MADIFQKLKRKSRKSSFTSSEEDNRLPEDKRSKFELLDEDREIDEVHSVLGVLPKFDMVLRKLEAMQSKLDSLESLVRNVTLNKVNALTTKVETLESTATSGMRSIKELDKG